MRILCATDGTPHSAKAVSFAGDLAKRLGADLTIVAVNVQQLTGRGTRSILWSDADAERILADATKAAKAAGAAKVEAEVIAGDAPADAIIEHAKAKGFDHIVAGTGGRTGVSRLVLGSVAADVAARAHCPVTVAH